MRETFMRHLAEAQERYQNVEGMVKEDLEATAIQNAALSLEVSAIEEKLIDVNKRIAASDKQLAESQGGRTKKRENFSVSL